MIDIHIHSIYSDGSKSIKEILRRCEQRKLDYMSITDHNSCGAYFDEALENNNIFSGRIIKGCEFNAQFQNRSIEILGYNINPSITKSWLENFYSSDNIRKSTKLIYDRFLNILDKKGIIYNEHAIRPLKKESELIERPIWEEIVKHEENKEIIGEEYFSVLRVFMRKELTNPNSEYFLNRASTFPKAREIVEFINQTGGMTFLAHPCEYKFDNIIKFMDDIKKESNLNGIECFHSSASQEEMQMLVDYARENNLYISGGSDYHGKLKPDIEIGVGKGNLNIPKNFIEEWIDIR